jgi:hypothetical protein
MEITLHNRQPIFFFNASGEALKKTVGTDQNLGQTFKELL